MKPLQNLAAVLVLMALQGCSTGVTVLKPSATLTDPSSIKPQTFVMRGQVVLGQAVSSITPCGSQNQYRLDLPKDRFRQGLSLVKQPYEPLYGEVIGYLAPNSKASGYSAKLVVDQINLLSAKSTIRCDQPIKATRAFGIETSWTVSLNQDKILFSQSDLAPQSFIIKSRRLTHDLRRYIFEDGNLELKQQSCIDRANNSLFGWTSTFTLGGKVYRGCASLSNQDTTQNWVSTYRAQTSENNPFSVTLRLNPDHSASTTYRYLSGESNTVEKGYWQQLSAQQIHVVSTHLQGQPLLSERLFSRHKDQISTKQEKVGSVIYDIANGGLTLFKSDTRPLKTQRASEHSLKENQIPSSDQFNPKVDKALREYFAQENIDPTGTRYRWVGYDLTDDGSEELLVQLDWCGTGGCTLLIFENRQQKWQLNSRMSLVQTPINLGRKTHHRWRDLVLFVSGGGATPNQHVMRYDGVSYPLNPSVAPVASYDEISSIQLFSDGLTPLQSGAML